MRYLQKIRRLTAKDRSLLARSVLMLATTRIALWVAPFRMVLRFADRYFEEPVDDGLTPAKITWAVSAVSRRMLRNKPCLTQALVLLMMFRRRSYPATLRIGVVKNAKGGLEAHAWVESEGQIVIGNLNNLSIFTALPPVKSTFPQ